MKLSDVNNALNHTIVSGAKYLWESFGPNVRFIDYESDYAYASAVYDTVTGVVYQANVSDKNDEAKNYRWTDPSYLTQFQDECKAKNIDPTVAWDNVKYTLLEVEEDFLEKATAIFEGKPFDNRIQIPLTLSDDLLLTLALKAHKRDITLNDMVIILLKEYMEDRDVNVDWT